MEEKKIMNDEELLRAMPALTAPEEGAVSYPDAGSALMAQKDFLTKRLSLVLGMEMNDANIERVRVLKKGIVGWRTNFDAQQKEYIKAVYKGPMDVFKACANEVMAEIQKMEAACDEVLGKEEEKRVANVNAVIDGLIEDLSAEYGIEFPDVERKKQYYNKTADMRAVAEDLRSQFQTKAQLVRQQAADREMIRTACGDDRRLDVSLYLGMLAYEPASVVYQKITAEKTRLDALERERDEMSRAAAASSPAPQAEEKVTLGVEVKHEALKSDFPSLLREMVLEIKYPVDTSEELTRIFGELRKSGVQMRVISKKEPEALVF